MKLFDRFKKGSPSQSGTSAEPEGSQPVTQVTDPPSGRGKGLLARLKQGLKKTSQLLNTDIRDLLKQEGRLVDEQLLDELFTVLIKTDMGVGPAGEIRDLIKSEFRGRVV